jgi:glycosyltransferase involved in cell wall biosynthesis
MNLLYTSTAYLPSTGGAQIHMHMLAVNLSPKHQVTVVSFWDKNRTDWLLGTTLRVPEHEKEYTIDNIHVHNLAFQRSEKFLLAPFVFLYYPFIDYSARKIAAIIEPKIQEFAQDVSLVHNVRIGREPMSLASLNLARRKTLPFVLTPVHHPRWRGWRYETYNELYRQADGVIALTNEEKKYLIQLGVKEEKVYVTGHGPVLAEHADPLRFRANIAQNAPIVLFLGQHYLYKGFLNVLEAAPLVWARIPEAHFVFIGPAVEQSEEYFQKNADPRIHRLGQVSLQEKTNALAASSVLCVPSSQESFGGVYTEAWAFQKPVIGCRIPAVTEVIADGVDGYLVHQDAREIADRVIDLLLHEDRASAMGQAGFQKLSGHFTWEKLSAKTESIYQQILGK